MSLLRGGSGRECFRTFKTKSQNGSVDCLKGPAPGDPGQRRLLNEQPLGTPGPKSLSQLTASERAEQPGLAKGRCWPQKRLLPMSAWTLIEEKLWYYDT
jgi:hypothetical protein